MKGRRTIFVMGGLLLALAIGSWLALTRSTLPSDGLLLLLPDGTSFSDPKVVLWLNAASEEGLHIVPVHDSEFASPLFSKARCAGVILPDSIHQQASDAFIASIRRFVAEGGKLMLVYDAGTFSLQGRYAADHSRLSDLAGVDYALYDTLHDKSILWSHVSGDREAVRQMEIPPGKYYPFRQTASASNPAVSPGTTEVQLRRYEFGDLDYPSFITSGNYSGRVIFHSSAGLVAGERTYQQGSVLFVNLPLGYLKSNTDGLLLHAFLKHFAEHSLSLPFLMPVPDGVGGLVLNWHIDSNAAIKPLQEMGTWSLLQQGPYSIHVTAGPDASTIGDTRGFDLDHNPVSQQLVRKYVDLGNEIGSHGGWIHDYFSAHVETDNPKDLEQFLALNQHAVERATGKPDLEYSAPSGNQPLWVTRWLEAHGFLAYYFTGNTGMGPTQGYRNGVREGQNIWAFPIAHLDRAAAFEEMSLQGYSDAEVQEWLEGLTQFAVDNRSVRLVYFHPPGVLQYRDVVARWMEQTARLKAEGRFRWYTMTQVATFLNARKQVHWNAIDNGRTVVIQATHPESLQHQTWRLPASKFSEPTVLRGSAHVTRDGDAWMVVAGVAKELRFESKKVGK